MAKMSQNVKEIIQVVVFVVVVVGLILVFVTYPLTRTKAYLARPDISTYKADSTAINDPSAFAELDAAVDTFRVEADGLTTLACAYLAPRLAPDSLGQPVRPRGTAVLLHGDGVDRKAMIPLAAMLLDSGWAVCLYDQRASGLSTGKYRSDGECEATDLTEVLGYLRIRDRLVRPLVAVGWQTGADAVLLTAAGEKQYDAIVAVSPYITSERWLSVLMKEHDMFWIPFPHSVFKFWYELRSGYAPQYRDLQGIKLPLAHTLLIDSGQNLVDKVIVAYVEQAKDKRIETAIMPGDEKVFLETIVGFLMLQRK
jgi:pimeloyl-ACP methyl ester carboxylesterase